MRLLLAALLVAFGTAQAADTPQWKWRDANGQVHVSDLPPPASVPDKSILERPTDPRRLLRAAPYAPAASAPATGASAVRPGSGGDPELEARRRRAADEQAAQQRQQEAQNAATKAENCTRARSQLQALSDGLRVARVNAQGEREILDDKGRAEEMQRARSIVASDCR